MTIIDCASGVIYHMIKCRRRGICSCYIWSLGYKNDEKHWIWFRRGRINRKINQTINSSPRSDAIWPLQWSSSVERYQRKEKLSVSTNFSLTTDTSARRTYKFGGFQIWDALKSTKWSFPEHPIQEQISSHQSRKLDKYQNWLPGSQTCWNWNAFASWAI